MATNNSNELENSVDTTPYTVVATNNNRKRWGISALSKSNKDIAYAEEIMMKKRTGELLIKTPENDIISYEYNSRLKNHLDIVTLMAYNMGICGKIYSADINGVDLPDVVDFDKNISSTMTFDEAYKKIMFSFDVDCLTVKEQELTNKNNIPDMEYRIFFRKNDTTIHSFEGTLSLNDFNNKIFQIPISDVYFDEVWISIKFIKNSAFNNDNVYRLILNSLLVVVE